MKKDIKDNFDVYNYCELLHTKRWEEFIKNTLNDKAKRECLDKMTKISEYNLSNLSEEEKKVKINKHPPYAIQWEGIMLDVDDIKGGVRKVDPLFTMDTKCFHRLLQSYMLKSRMKYHQKYLVMLQTKT